MKFTNKAFTLIELAFFLFNLSVAFGVGTFVANRTAGWIGFIVGIAVFGGMIGFWIGVGYVAGRGHGNKRENE